MKTLKILTIMALIAFFSSCSDDDSHETTLTEDEIPTAIVTYVTTYFPNNAIISAIKDSESTTATYEIYLEGNIELDFNSSYEITDIDGINQLPDAVIPETLLDYIAIHYPDNYVTDWELESNYQQIELNNRITLEFTMEGAFIRIDND